MKMKIHYAMSATAACGREMANFLPGSPMMQHTTIREKVTCKQCLRKLNELLGIKKDVDGFSI